MNLALVAVVTNLCLAQSRGAACPLSVLAPHGVTYTTAFEGEFAGELQRSSGQIRLARAGGGTLVVSAGGITTTATIRGDGTIHASPIPRELSRLNLVATIAAGAPAHIVSGAHWTSIVDVLTTPSNSAKVRVLTRIVNARRDRTVIESSGAGNGSLAWSGAGSAPVSVKLRLDGVFDHGLLRTSKCAVDETVGAGSFSTVSHYRWTLRNVASVSAVTRRASE